MLNASQIKRLEKLADLKRLGALTDAEFDTEKANVLADSEGQFSPSHGSAGSSWRMGDSYAQPFHIPSPPDSFQSFAVMPINRYADFFGRSSRREFWYFQLSVAAIYLVSFVIVASSIGSDSSTSTGLLLMLLGVFSLGIIVPAVAVQVRRFHDQDKSGWFVLLNFIPYIGPVIVLVMMMLEGSQGENRFGSIPIV